MIRLLTVVTMLVVFLAGCSMVTTPYGSSARLGFLPDRKMGSYADPRAQVDPGQTAYHHGGDLGPVAGITSVAQLPPDQRRDAINGIVKVAEVNTGWGNGFNSNMPSQRPLQCGYIINRTCNPAWVDIQPINTTQVGCGSIGRVARVSVAPMSMLPFNLFPGRYEFIARDESGSLIRRAPCVVNWVSNGETVYCPGGNDRISTDWAWNIR